MKLSLLTLNIHKGFNLLGRRLIISELREAIRESGADLVCLQEVLGEHELHRSKHDWWPDNAQYEYLADQVWSDHAYGKNAAYPHGHHGNAILSRYPMLSSENFDVSANPVESRGILEAKIDIDGKTLRVLCCHFGLLKTFRKWQFEKLGQLAQSSSEACVIAGDFNDWDEASGGQSIESEGFVEVFRELKGGVAKSYPAFFPMLKLDRVYSRGLRPKRAQVLKSNPWGRLSDHAPLFVEFEISES